MGLLICGIAAFWMPTATFAAEEAPAWLRQAASATAPVYPRQVPAVVLLNEEAIKVDDDGKLTTVHRYAVRVLSIEGRGAARGSVTYTTDFGKVKDIRGWVIRPSEEVKRIARDEILDLAVVDNDVYNESRKKVISAADNVEPGAVFGYEYILEEKSVFTQVEWYFQTMLPTLVSRFSVTLPANWKAESVTFNSTNIEPVINGSVYTWELKNLPYIEYEPALPPITTLAPRLAVSYFSAAGSQPGPGKSFKSWADVSRWLTDLSDSQAIVNDAIAAKARELTANAKTEFEKIRAIGRFAQGINYISVQTGLGRGGGYRPHSSVDVFTKSYGDCKDKANLMRAMLKSIGIPSYLVCIFSGDPTYVREEWPSPQQFNHCIIAVKVNDATKAATLVTHPTLGRLLIFDPTDDNTPVGDLPDHEQNSLALIIAGDAGALLRMPVTPPEMNNLERTVDVTLGADGSIAAKVSQKTVGQPAVELRSEFRSLSRPEYVKMIERWVTRGATGASVLKVEPTDDSGEGKFSLDVDFSAARYGQVMQGRLLVFKPAIVSRREALALTESSRKHPVMLDPSAYTETVRVKLPDGFAVDELPDAVKLNAAFGNYSTSYDVKEGVLHFTRSLVVRSAMIPAAEYEKVRSFFASMRAAEQAPVVLAKK